MSGLLQKPGDSAKNNKKIERIETTTPANTYNPNDVFTVKHENSQANIPPISKQEKSTSIRCSFGNKDRLNALVVLNGSDSVDQILDILLDEYEATMTPEERRELRTIINIYSKKR